MVSSDTVVQYRVVRIEFGLGWNCRASPYVCSWKERSCKELANNMRWKKNGYLVQKMMNSRYIFFRQFDIFLRDFPATFFQSNFFPVKFCWARVIFNCIGVHIQKLAQKAQSLVGLTEIQKNSVGSKRLENVRAQNGSKASKRLTMAKNSYLKKNRAPECYYFIFYR